MRSRGQAAEEQEAQGCELCRQRKGRNKMIAHQLAFRDEDTLRRHLQMTWPGSDQEPTRASVLNWWYFVRRYYGRAAADKWQPLALVYFEAHGVNVVNRAEWIMQHRGRYQRPIVESDAL